MTSEDVNLLREESIRRPNYTFSSFNNSTSDNFQWVPSSVPSSVPSIMIEPSAEPDNEDYDDE
jgi:hypothetical protein